MIAAAALAALLPFSAPPAPVRSPSALSVSPARVALAGIASRAVRVTNTGSVATTVEVSSAPLALDRQGRARPAGAARAGGSGWLVVHPRELRLPAGAGGTLTVASRLRGRVAPGDRFTLVLLTTRPHREGRVVVALRVGVVVGLRVPGRIVHRLQVAGLRSRRTRRGCALRLLVSNRGNVSEVVRRGQVDVSLLRRGRVFARLRPPAREIFPRTTAAATVLYGGPVRGRVTAVVRLRRAGTAGTVSRRSFRLRL